MNDGTEIESSEATSEPQEVSVREAAEAAWDEHSSEDEDAQEDAGEPLEASDDTQDEEALESSEEAEDDALEADDVSDEPIEYPSAWSDEIRKKMQSADPEFQKWAADFTRSQQSSFTQKMQELSGELKQNAALRETLQPYEQYIAEDGDTVEQRVGELLQLDQQLDTNPVAAIRQLCAECEIDPRQLIGGGQGYDPGFAQYQDQYSQASRELETRLQNAEGKLQQYEVQAMQADAEKTLDQWANAKDSDGNLLRPYYKQLETQLVPVIRELRQIHPHASHVEILDQAYDQVYNAFSSLQKEALKSQAQKAKDKAAKASRAGSSVKGAPGGKVAGKKKEYNSVREAAEAAWNEYA